MRRIIGDDERAFKGVFIPAELWLNEDLSPMELLLMTEIDSLDKKNGCHASNKHFASFLGLTAGRVSQMINDLAKRGHLALSYERNGKQIVSRSIKVVRNLNTPIKNSKGGYLENANNPSAKTKGGYLENAEESNTSRVIQNSNTDRVLGTGTRYPDARDEKSDDQQSDKLRSFDLWEQNWGFPNGVAQQDLTDWIHEFGDDLVAWTIEFALRRNISSHGADSWLMKAFDRYRQEGVTTVEQAAERAEQHRQQVSREIKQRKSGRYGRAKRVEKLPDWAKEQSEPQSQSAPPDPGLAKPSAEQLADTKKLLADLKAKRKKQKAGAKT